MVFGLSWPVAPALLFGVLIAATDPVAVIAMFKDNGIEGRLRLLVESESLFNDGVAAVLFSLVLAGTLTTHGQAITATEAARALLSAAAYSSASPVRGQQLPWRGALRITLSQAR